MANKKIKAKGGLPIVRGARKIRLKELSVFTRQMSAMLAAGMPLVQTLAAMEEQTDDKNFKPVINGIRTRVEGGCMYSEALAFYPSVFDELYVSMMRAGEVGGCSHRPNRTCLPIDHRFANDIQWRFGRPRIAVEAKVAGLT